jgi:hypothetical protein
MYAFKIKENEDIGYFFKFDKRKPLGTLLLETCTFIQQLLLKGQVSTVFKKGC